MSGTALRLRAPADVRAIPSDEWERWLEAGTVPFVMFSAERWTQRVLRDVLAATVCRMAAR
jgi:hypothetical protein